METNLASLSAGDTMYVRTGTGTYNEGEVTIGVSGSSGSPITIRNYPGESMVWQDAVGDRTFDITGDWIVIDGFEFDKQSHMRQAVRVNSGADNVTIQNCTIHDGNYYTLVEVRGDNCTIDNCIIYDNDQGPNEDAHGITIGDCSTFVLSNSTIYDCRGDCIHVYDAWGAVNGYTIEDNTFYTTVGGGSENGIDVKDGRAGTQDIIRGNTIYGFEDCDGSTGGTGASGEAINIHDEAENVLIEDNLIYDCETGIRILSHANDVTIQNNVIRDLKDPATWPESAIVVSSAATGILIYNNTIHNAANYIYRFNGSTVTIKNNIHNDSGEIELLGGETLTYDYNHWDNCTDTLAGGNDVSGDPLFIDEAGDDYRLQCTSPCVDAGTPVGISYLDDGPDIGAYEATCGSNLVVFQDNGNTRFIFGKHGGAYADSQWTTFSEHDDLALLAQLDATLGGQAMEYWEALEQLGLMRPVSGGVLLNRSRLQMLRVGAIQQVAQEWAKVKRLIDE